MRNIILLSLGDAAKSILSRSMDRMRTDATVVHCICDFKAEASVPGHVEDGASITLNLLSEIYFRNFLNENDTVKRQGHQIVTVVALGGRAGSMYARLLAQHQFQYLQLSRVYCVTPFRFEGEKRNRLAEETLAGLDACKAPVARFSNQDVLTSAHPSTTFAEAFEQVDRKILADLVLSGYV